MATDKILSPSRVKSFVKGVGASAICSTTPPRVSADFIADLEIRVRKLIIQSMQLGVNKRTLKELF